MTPLEAARAIGQTLCASAYWDDEGRMCNWLGRADREGIAPGTVTPATGALEQNLYRGSTGVALFLAELSTVTGDAEPRRTALGGLRRSIGYFLNRPLERAVPLSFFLGHLGAAYVARRLLDAAPEPELEEAIGRLLAEVRRSLSEPHPLDLLGGSAGAIPALLHLARRGHAGCREMALSCGLELRRAAERQGPYVTWPGEAVAGPAAGGAPSPALTGFSHGASGLAVALLELYGEAGNAGNAGDMELRDLARGAFAYEDTFFSPPDANWRDPREAVAASGFQTAWCHGAPGIALARLRAMSLDPELRDAHAATARIALGSALAALERGLARPRHDATLCHGLTGLSEILLLGGTLLDEPIYKDAASRAAGELVRRHAAAGDWPTGMPSGGPSPALMLGTAGIGHHLLRLHAPERVPPVLLLLPDR